MCASSILAGGTSKYKAFSFLLKAFFVQGLPIGLEILFFCGQRESCFSFNSRFSQLVYFAVASVDVMVYISKTYGRFTPCWILQ